MTAKRTPLFSRHQALGAQMLEFGGWMLPVQFKSIRDEHAAVRDHAGLFDISHMGVITVRGTRAADFLQWALTNDLSHLSKTGKVQYTCMCREDGGIIDDLLVYENFEEGMLLVVNAANTDADLAWLWQQIDVKGYDLTEVSVALRTDLSMIALQGPKAVDLLQRFVSCDLGRLPYYNGMPVRLRGRTLACGRGPAILSRTGYTGEDGFEVIAPADMIVQLWDQLIDAGASPCGLAARDILRLEMGYCLHGQDISVETTPLQAGLGWIVSFKKPDRFIGRDALERERAQGPSKRLIGLVLEEKGVPRHGYRILRDGQPVGETTSGAFSPRLDKGIALGYVKAPVATEHPPLSIEIRSRPLPARIVELPFYHPPKPARLAVAATIHRPSDC